MPLPRPRTADGQAGLRALLADPGRALVALDFDGTLSPIVDDPTTSRLADGGAAALTAVATRVGRLAIVTGRPALTAVELGDLTRVPGLVVEGQYGAEQWQDGELRTAPAASGVAAVRAALPGLLADADAAVWIEDKALSLVVHTRRAAAPEAELDRLAPALVALAERNGMEGNAGRNVLELRPPGIDKGGALYRLVERFAPTAVLYAGDDVGDLPAYAAVEVLRARGLPGLTVASASEEVTGVVERADLVVDGPPGVVALLRDLAAEIG